MSDSVQICFRLHPWLTVKRLSSFSLIYLPPSPLLSPVPKGRHVEGSEFLNEQDSAKVGLVSGLNGKTGPWSFEELIDLNVNSKSRPLIEAGDCNQGLINGDGSPDGTRVAFEDKGTPVNALHSSSQPIEALPGESHCRSLWIYLPHLHLL